jgi:proline dehydrogenase
MGISRNILLGLSESPWLRQRAPHWWFVRNAARRFMPGEHLEDALTVARGLREKGIGVVLTELGENVTDRAAADEVARHYTDVLAGIRASALSCHLSVKLTQLGLDVDLDRCHANVRALVAAAHQQGTFLWIDMEQHTYVDRTLLIYRRLLSEFANVGVCLQAYLYRTREDLRLLLPLGGGIRLVKGAYREAAGIAYPKKHDVDSNFVALAAEMLSAARRNDGARFVFGTHDRRMLNYVARHARDANVSRDAFEFHLLFGIGRADQIRLAQEGYLVRVLISYGSEWFPWYMRRLAERPANVVFAARAMLR